MNPLRSARLTVYEEAISVIEIDSSWNSRSGIFVNILKVYEESSGELILCGSQ